VRPSFALQGGSKRVGAGQLISIRLKLQQRTRIDVQLQPREHRLERRQAVRMQQDDERYLSELT
jgi:hypothetical protein